HRTCRMQHSDSMPYTTLFRYRGVEVGAAIEHDRIDGYPVARAKEDGHARFEFRCGQVGALAFSGDDRGPISGEPAQPFHRRSRLDRKSTRLNSSHVNITYAVF